MWGKKSAYWSTSGDTVRLHSRSLLTYSFWFLFFEINKVAYFDCYTIIRTAYRIPQLHYRHLSWCGEIILEIFLPGPTRSRDNCAEPFFELGSLDVRLYSRKIKNRSNIRENNGQNRNVGHVGRVLGNIGQIQLLSLPILVPHYVL